MQPSTPRPRQELDQNRTPPLDKATKKKKNSENVQTAGWDRD